MALQGTIDTFPLTDVLALLASSKKTGRLALDGDRGRAALWIIDGEIVGGDVLGAAAPTAASLLFELLRYGDASFAFDVTPEGSEPEHSVPATTIETGLRDASTLLGEWDAIVAVVPSLAHRVLLVHDLPEDSVTLDAATWSLVLAAATTPVVAAIGDALELDEFGACAAVASLVERGLATIAAPSAFDPPPATSTAPEALATATPAESSADPFADQSSGDDATDADTNDGRSSEIVLSDLSEATDDRAEREFPDHFPIDDLLGSDASDADDAWSSPEMEQLEAQRRAASTSFDSVAFDGLPPLEGVPFDEEPRAAAGPDAWDDLLPADESDEDVEDARDDSTDEVLRQMSKLSPQAAEAIAAALNSVPAPSSSGEPASSGSDGDGDGPVKFSGMF